MPSPPDPSASPHHAARPAAASAAGASCTVAAPSSESELKRRAQGLAGLTLGELACRVGTDVPKDLKRAKGWVGGLLEQALGATAKSRPAPDFEELSVELKTLPVNRAGHPLETTFVCTIPLLEVGDTEWRQSRVYKKLKRVLWVPVLGQREVPVAARTIAHSLLWSPSEEEEAQLRWDWEELSGIIGRGEVDQVTGHLGVALQVRPKAANSRVRRRGTDADGNAISVLPRGFYLRTSFTAAILRRSFVLPGSQRQEP